MTDSITREKIGEFDLTRHRQLSDIDRAIKAACGSIDMSANGIRAALTSCREMSTNMINHAGGGTLTWYVVREEGKVGIEIIFDDQGPGIADLEQAWIDGYSSNGGLGLGLGGARRMMDSIHIDSSVDAGTRVRVIKWR